MSNLVLLKNIVHYLTTSSSNEYSKLDNYQPKDNYKPHLYDDEFILPDTPVRILVVGESGVGKTEFIRSIRNNSIRSPPSEEAPYIPTRKKTTTYVSHIRHLPYTNLMDEIQNRKFSRTFIRFLLTPQTKQQISLIDSRKLFEHYAQQKTPHPDMLITEIPSSTTDAVSCEYDYIIVMAEYSDITTMRSLYYWIQTMNCPPEKTIICINKCDVEPISLADDFQSRKAKILEYFLQKYPVEYISVKTKANIQFIYKYLSNQVSKEEEDNETDLPLDSI